MLASITPLGERGRQMRWGITVAAFLLGALAGGVGAGALLGAVGSLTLSGVGAAARLGAFSVLAVTALALDLRALALGRARVPGPGRQVDERWRDQFRGWVYGLGYGAQLGLGATTIVSSAATYLALAAAVLSGSAVSGALIAGLYGLLRGATPLAAGRVRRPDQLARLLRGLDRGRAAVPRLVCAALGAILVLAAVGSLT